VVINYTIITRASNQMVDTNLMPYQQWHLC